MALINCVFNSRYLGYDTQVNVILPENKGPQKFDEDRDYQFQVMYLLHGLGDDCNGWIRGTSIERYAQEHCLAVVMPTGENSFYVNGKNGKRYFSYMTEELPKKMAKWFPISTKPEDTFIAGLSMGGYGTVKIGLTYPERFAAMGVFSAAVMPDKLGEAKDSFEREMVDATRRNAFGELPYDPENLPVHLVEELVREGRKIPPIFHYEGKQDFLLDMNREFAQLCKSKNLDITYEEWDGVHDWKFWDTAIEKALNAFPLKNRVLYKD